MAWSEYERLGLKKRHLRRLDRVLEGESNQTIAEILRLSPRTVANYVSDILDATRCRSRSELIARYYHQGVNARRTLPYPGK
ncbi:MAG: response regulator transcription factor [Tepidiformaceae bacterium]